MANEWKTQAPLFPISQLQQMLTQDTSLQTTDVELLAIAQGGEISPTRHRAHPP